MRLARLIVTVAALCVFGMYGQAKKDGEAKGAPPAAKSAEKSDKGTKGSQCVAKTKEGGQCKRKASAGSQYCWQHGGKKKS